METAVPAINPARRLGAGKGLESNAANIAPGPRGLPLLGSLLDVGRDKLRFLMECVSTYGDVVRFRIGPRVFHFVNHPDYIKHVLQDNYRNYRVGLGLAHAKPLLGDGLLTSDDAVWSRQRRMSQPAFALDRVATWIPAITDGVTLMRQRWQGNAERREPINIAGEMTKLALDILGRTILGTNLASHSELIGDTLAVALRETARRMIKPVQLPLSIPLPGNRRFRNAIRTLEELVYGIINQRRGASTATDDLLARLLQARDESNGQGLTDRELRDHVMTMLLAGHETTSNALAWTWYLLAQNPAVQHHLQAEVADRLGGQTPTFADLAHLRYARMVVEESMRLYPPVWLIPRQAVEADRIGGYDILPRSGVLVSPYAMHRHPAYWAEPETFDPGRFAEEKAANRPTYVYLPFGGGPRRCIGAHFGMVEVLLVVVMVVQHYHLNLVPGQTVKPEALLSLRPAGGVFVSLVNESGRIQR